MSVVTFIPSATGAIVIVCFDVSPAFPDGRIFQTP
jgi:hypothetical protein